MSSTTADTIVTNGHIHTLDLKNSVVTSMAIKDGRIAAVGDHDSVQRYQGSGSQVIDLQGKTMLPGFIESHGHFMWIGEVRTQIDLLGVDDINKVEAAVAEVAKKSSPGSWIHGHSWDQELWGAAAFPDHRPITRAAPDNPVVLVRRDGHSWWVNKAALDHASFGPETPDPPGGVIVRDSDGYPTGMLIDTARSVLGQKIPPASRAEEQLQFEIARDECLRYGVTSFHEMKTGARMLEFFAALAEQDRLRPRLYCYLDAQDNSLLETYYKLGPRIDPDGYLTVRGVKLFADGALGSRGALLMDSYANDAGNRGIEVLDPEEMIGYGMKAARHGFQLSIHAIGDRAAYNSLNVYEQIGRQIDAEAGGNVDHRFRIEHAEILRPEDVARFAKLGVIAAIQATHHTSDMSYLEGHLGRERVEQRASMWRELVDSGAVVCGGSDTPIESTDPLVGIYASVTRKSVDGYPNEGWGVEQAMTREEAVRSYTTAAAYAAFEEEEKGSFEVGKLADAVLLSRDIMTIPAPQLLDTKVLFTMIGGELVYQT